ncbi:MAG TPA: signal peptidase II [Xanthobacteraceae bacterium]|nr:signal peptidase II [Xanthobacteraceae bacterium]
MSYLYGPLTRLGLFVALIALLADQGIKLWLLYAYDLGTRGAVPVIPFFDLVLVWNKGISYGLFPQEAAFGQWLLLGVKTFAVIVMWIWLARANSKLIAVALGLIIGGALGNAVDRALHGAVVDYVLFKLTPLNIDFYWYVFNLADAAIVAGVALVLYDSVIGTDAAKAP